MSFNYVLCAHCSRHLRASETACPFCGGSLEEPRASFTLPRLTRSALFAVALGTASCGTGGPSGNDAASDAPAANDAPDAPLPVGAYGGPPPTDAGAD